MIRRPYAEQSREYLENVRDNSASETDRINAIEELEQRQLQADLQKMQSDIQKLTKPHWTLSPTFWLVLVSTFLVFVSTLAVLFQIWKSVAPDNKSEIPLNQHSSALQSTTINELQLKPESRQTASLEMIKSFPVTKKQDDKSK